MKNVTNMSLDTYKGDYGTQLSKDKMKHLIGSEVNEDDLVVDSNYTRGRLRSNYSNEVCNYCKK